jgi:segregation and condensation protein B
MQEVDAKAIVEAALLTAQRPLGFRELQALLGEQVGKESLRAALDALVADWSARGSLQLSETAAGWRFATSPSVRPHLEALHAERPQRYSRAVMETLAVIAYRQPVTRGDIEDIRGVAVGSPIIKQLEDRGWIDCIGHRDAPGRPALYATTRQFLDDLGLPSLSALPPLSAPDGTPLLPDLPAQAALPLVDDDLLGPADALTEPPAVAEGESDAGAGAEAAAGAGANTPMPLSTSEDLPEEPSLS